MEVIHLLAKVCEKYQKLDVQNPGDLSEFYQMINRCTHLVMIRDVRRNDPKTFPIITNPIKQIFDTFVGGKNE